VKYFKVSIDLFEPDTFRFLHGFFIIGAFYKFNKTSGENKSSSEKMEENIFQFSRISYTSAGPCVYITEAGISKTYCTVSWRIRIFNCIEEVPRFFFSIEFNSAFQISNCLQFKCTPYTV
jgi:hypothetical protein